MHTYQKLRAFVISQGSRITTTTTWKMDQLKLIQPKGSVWKQLAYAEVLLHTVLGFAMVTTVAYAIPEVIHSPTRLTVFWMYIFTYLFLGLLTFLGLYQKSSAAIKVALAAFMFLQLVVLLTTSRILGQCKAPSSRGKLLQGSSGSSGSVGYSAVDCQYSGFIGKTILIPLFIHSFIFCFVLITFLFKSGSTEGAGIKKCHQFANIKIIIEEVP